MKAPQENTQEPQQDAIQRVEQESSSGGEATIADNRPVIVAQRKLRSAMGGADDTNNPIQRKTNNTGLPDNLKSGIENLSGYSMDDVKVHYNSSKPAQLQAHAYAQGTDIHLAPGQEKHLPHEAWHVVQQKQGRVKPTRQLKSKVNINDDVGLEKEADVMGNKALEVRSNTKTQPKNTNTLENNFVQRKIIGQPKIYETKDGNYKETIKNFLENKTTAIQEFTNYLDFKESLESIRKEDLLTMYHAAMKYIEDSNKGKEIIDELQSVKDTIRIVIGKNYKTTIDIKDEKDNESDADIEVFWNPLALIGFWNNERAGIVSPASVLLHELGHVLQYLREKEEYREAERKYAGTKHEIIEHYNFENQSKNGTTQWTIEHHNLTHNEHPFNKEKKEPLRNKYSNAYAELDFEHNSNIKLDEKLSEPFQERVNLIAKKNWSESVIHHTNQDNTKERVDPNLNREKYKETLSEVKNDKHKKFDSLKIKLNLILQSINKKDNIATSTKQIFELFGYLDENVAVDDLIMILSESDLFKIHDFLKTLEKQPPFRERKLYTTIVTKYETALLNLKTFDYVIKNIENEIKPILNSKKQFESSQVVKKVEDLLKYLEDRVPLSKNLKNKLHPLIVGILKWRNIILDPEKKKILYERWQAYLKKENTETLPEENTNTKPNFGGRPKLPFLKLL